jgi:glycerophosphoryl diester phosphodiesterase
MPISAAAMPMIVAHRGGTGEMPENTVPAFRSALEAGADALWMTVQVTQDGVPVMYRPADLSALTDGKGPVSGWTYAQLQRLNAGYAFKGHGDVAFPYRTHPVGIPTLREALAAVPPNVPILLDMKQTPVQPLVDAVAAVLAQQRAWQRVRLYSTDADATRAMARYPQAQLFESRDATRARLVHMAFNGECDAPPSGTWSGIEFHRQVEVIERYTLGEGVTKVDAHWWTPAAVQCFKEHGDVHLMAFGVENAADYARAQALGLDAVMTDSPHALRKALTALPQK